MVYRDYFHGQYPSLDPGSLSGYNEVSTSYTIATGRIGSTASAQTAMQVAEVDARLREGMSTVEMGVISPDIFDRIPKKHFEEIRQLSKVAGADITLHAPLIDPSGFKEGRWGGENARQEAERHLKQIMEKAMTLRPEGGIPVTIHGADVSVQAMEWEKIPGKKEPVPSTMTVVRQDTGSMTILRREKEYFPGRKEPEIRTPMQKLESANASEWQSNLLKVQDLVKEAGTWIDKAEETGGTIIEKARQKGEIKGLTEEQAQVYNAYQNHMNRANMYNQEAQLRLRTIFDSAMKFPANDEAKKVLNDINDFWQKNAKEQKKLGKKGELTNLAHLKSNNDLFEQTIQVFDKNLSPPKLFVPVEEFALKYAAETISNVAVDAAMKGKNFKDKTPMLTIENVWPNVAFSRADKLKGLIDESRKKFVKKAVENGADRDKAKKMSEKMIGATWDIAHINLMRKYGFKEEDIMKESEKIAKYIKHVHLGDNFGHYDTDLPLGMGNAPIKKFMKMLKDRGYDGKAILESGGFSAHFKGASSQPYALEALDAPIRYGGLGGESWSVVGTNAEHFSGYGKFLPDQHFAMYGGGFSQLPVELGGQAPGGGGRFSGTPMA